MYLSILEGATTPTAELIRTLGTPEVHAAAPSQVIAHVTSRTLWRIEEKEGVMHKYVISGIPPLLFQERI